MANKTYLDQEGLERLVQYINDALKSKADAGDIPEDVVLKDELANYAKIDELGIYIDENELASELSAYPTNEALQEVLNAYPTNEALQETLDAYATNNDLDTLRGEVTGVYHYRGSVANLEELQAVESPMAGDVYNLEDTGMNAAWTGEQWDEFGTIADLSNCLMKEDIDSIPIPTVDSILYSGKSAVVSDLAGLNAMLANDKTEVNITLSDDVALTDFVTVPAGKKLNLDLGGNSLDASGVALYANGGELVISNGNVASSASDAIVIRNGGSVTIDGANITSTSRNAISAKEGNIIVNSGNIQSQEAGLLGLKDSTITINGGTITGIDNCPMMGNGSPAGSQNDGTNMNVIMNGGTLIAHIQSAGYTACGVYVPNSGSFTMNGGEIISDGCGICQRGGTVNLNGGKITANGAADFVGKVGDSRVVVGSYAVVYDANSKYPDMANLELNIGSDMVLEGTDGDIQILLADGVEANINDNR